MNKERKGNGWRLSCDAAHTLHRKGTPLETVIRDVQIVPDPDEWEELPIEAIPRYTTEEYNSKVSELIHQRYSADMETSLINNILSDSPTEAHREEYAAYQDYRAECKARAKAILSEAAEDESAEE